MKFLLRFVEIADFCSLKEALVWVNQRKYPLTLFNDEGYDCFDNSTISNRNSFEGTSLFDSEENIKSLFPNYFSVKEDEEVSKSKLFIALKEGKIKFNGIKFSKIKVNNKSASKSMKIEDITSADMLGNLKAKFNYEEIPTELYSYDSINWENSILYTNKNDGYCALVTDLNDLLKAFPELNCEDFIIERYGNSLIFNGDNYNITEPKGKSAGRKNIVDWDLVHPYITKKFLEYGDVIPKQEHVAEDIREWIFKEFNISVGKTTIQAKLKFYWDLLKSEK